MIQKREGFYSRVFCYVLSIILAAALLLVAAAAFITAAHPAAALPTDYWIAAAGFDIDSGTGSDGDPYIIKTPEQLAYLAQQVNGGNSYSGEFIKLYDNLDLSEHLWTPIGIYNSKPFSGTLTETVR